MSTISATITDPGNQRGLDWQHASIVVKDAPFWPEEDQRVEPRTESWDILACYGGIAESVLDKLTPEQRYDLLADCTPGPEYRMDTPAWAGSTDYYAPEYDGTGRCSHCLEISAPTDAFTVSIHRLDSIHLDGTVEPGETYLWAEAPSAGISPDEALRLADALRAGALRLRQIQG